MVTMLCACVFMTPVKHYAGDDLSDAEIAINRSYVVNPFTDECHGTITAYTKIVTSDFLENKKFEIAGFSYYTKQTNILPGVVYSKNIFFKGFISKRLNKKLVLEADKNISLNFALMITNI